MGWYMKTVRSQWWVVAAVLLLCPLVRAQSQETQSVSDTPAAIVPLSGQIDDYSRDDLVRRFDKAKALGAKVVIVEIDSPGGLVTSSMDISRYLKRQDDVRTIAFVKDKAYSGAAMVAMACNEIWMAPSSALGDCAPIVFDTTGRLEPLPDTERAKQESPILDEFRDSARRNGYNPLLAEAMVEVQKSVYLVQNSAGQYRAVDEPEYKKLTAQGEWKPAPDFDNPIDGPTSLLTVHPREAKALGLSRGEASSAQALASKLGERVIADLTPGFGEKLVELLNNPFVRMILLTIFLQALYIALHAPGHGAAEAVAIVSIGLLVGIPLLTGYAQWWEVMAIFVGLALCAFEIFVFPGHMVSLIAGVVLIVLGLVMTFAGKEPSGVPGWLPSLGETWHGIQQGLVAVVGALICSFFLSMWIRRYLPSIPYFRRLILTATSGNTAELAATARPRRDEWPFVGTVGVAVTDLHPGGSVEFPYADSTRSTAVVSTGAYISAGSKVAVEEVEGNCVRVRAIG